MQSITLSAAHTTYGVSVEREQFVIRHTSPWHGYNAAEHDQRTKLHTYNNFNNSINTSNISNNSNNSEDNYVSQSKSNLECLI